MQDDHNELTRALGRIEGKLDMIVARQSSHGDRLDTLDERLRHVEQQAAKAGAISGGMVAISTAIAAEVIKRAFM